MSGEEAELTVAEREFIGAYILSGFNGSEAARNIGRGGKYPDRYACRLLARPAVKGALEARLKAKELKAEVTIERIAARYAELAFAAHDGPLTATNVIAALEALGKYKGMFKSEQAVVIPVTFQFVGGPPLAIDDGGAPMLDISPRPAHSQAPTVLLGPDKPVPKGS